MATAIWASLCPRKTARAFNPLRARSCHRSPVGDNGLPRAAWASCGIPRTDQPVRSPAPETRGSTGRPHPQAYSATGTVPSGSSVSCRRAGGSRRMAAACRVRRAAAGQPARAGSRGLSPFIQGPSRSARRCRDACGCPHPAGSSNSAGISDPRPSRRPRRCPGSRPCGRPRPGRDRRSAPDPR